MTTIHLRKPVLLVGAVSVTAATLAAETSAQSRPTAELFLSDAMAEALRTPFHGDHAPSGSLGLALLPGPVGSLPSPAPQPQPPGTRVPAKVTAPSAGKVFVSTAVAAAVGYFGTFYVAELCEPEPGRYDGGLNPWAPLESEQGNIQCSADDSQILRMGFLATIPVVASGAWLVGSGFPRSLLGSALGFAGGMGALFAVSELGDLIGLEGDFEIPKGAAAAVLSLAHAAVTTVVAN